MFAACTLTEYALFGRNGVVGVNTACTVSLDVETTVLPGCTCFVLASTTSRAFSGWGTRRRLRLNVAETCTSDAETDPAAGVF